jgi:hypothetical protein
MANAEPPQCLQAPFGMSSDSPFRSLSGNTNSLVRRAQVTDPEDCLFLKSVIRAASVEQ